MTNETNPSYKAITKEQIESLANNGITHVSLDSIRALYDNAPSVYKLESERESLIAENAMMLEALRDAEESLSRFTSDEGCIQKDFDTCDHVHHALANTKPRLVEVGRWVEGVTEDESDFYPITYCGREGSGVMCYTIQKGEG